MANAVLDGVDCIMLGAETLRGKHPVATVETILHICKQAEKVFDHNYHFETLMRVRASSCSVLQHMSQFAANNLPAMSSGYKTKVCCDKNDSVSCVNGGPHPHPSHPPPCSPPPPSPLAHLPCL